MNLDKEKLLTPENLIRLEIFFAPLFGLLFSFFISRFSDIDFNETLVFGLVFLFFAVFITSLFLKLTKKTLRLITSLIYFILFLLILHAVYENSFNISSFFILMCAYALYCLTLSSIKAFLIINSLVSFFLFSVLFLMNFDTETPLSLIIGTFFTIVLTGFFASASRVYYRRRLKERENLMNAIFNHSSDGLILGDLKREKIFNANNRALDILGIGSIKLLKEKSLQKLKIDGKEVFDDLEEEQSKTQELSDNRLLTITAKRIKNRGKKYELIEIKEFSNLQELSVAQEFDKLKSITEESYESLFNSSASLMCVIDDKEKIIDINKTFLDFLGYESSDLIGKDFSCIDYKNYEEERKEINKRAWKGETQFFEKEIVSKEGKIVFIEVILRKAKYFGKDVLISNSRDISQRKLLKKIAEYNYLQYSTLFKESSISLVISDLDGDIIEINQSFERLLGYKKEEILGSNIREFTHKEDYEKSLMLRKKLIKGEISQLEMQKRYITKEGDTVHVLLKKGIQKDENDEPSKLLAQIVDISEFVRAEGKIKESEKSYKDVFNNSFELLYILDRNNCFLDVNKAVIDEYGYTKAEIVGRQPEIFSAEGKNDFDDVFKKINLAWEGKDQQLLWWSRRKDGSIFPKDLHLRKGVYFGKEVLMCSGRNISDEFAYEQQLIKSEKKYKDLIHKSIFGILIFKDDYIVFANNKAIELLKYNSSENLVGKHRDDVLQVENQKALEQRVNRLKEGKKVNLEEFKLITADGTTISVESMPTIIEYEGDQCILSSFVDISHRKEAESAQQKIIEAKTVNKTLKLQLEQNRLIQRRLQNSQSYSEGIIESSLDMIFTTDIKGKITKLNGAAKKELQYSDEDFIKKPFELLLKNKEKGNQILEALNKKNAFSGEIEMLRKDETFFTAFLSISYLFNTDGTFLGIMGVSRDISDILSKEQEIKDQASKLTSIIESSSHLFFTVNKNYRITSFNKLFKQDIKDKYDIEMELFDDFFKLYKDKEEEEKEQLKESWLAKFNTAFNGDSTKFEVEREATDGSHFFREIYLNPIYSEEGNIEEVSGIGHDTTQKKLYEIELRNSLNEKEILLKEVHHRVKNNMQVISSILNLQSAYVKDESILSVLRESQNRISAMASIHERLYRTKNFSDIKFSAYVRNLAESLVNTYELSKTSVELSFSLDEVFLTLNTAIPCGLIINELISNSLKYAFVGRDRGKIEISLRQRQNKVTLTISDNGMGMPEAINMNNTDTLGLQLVSTLVEQIDGTIKLNKKKGTSFSIEFNTNLEE